MGGGGEPSDKARTDAILDWRSPRFRQDATRLALTVALQREAAGTSQAPAAQPASPRSVMKKPFAFGEAVGLTPFAPFGDAP
jgi:hypothetical protein